MKAKQGTKQSRQGDDEESMAGPSRKKRQLDSEWDNDDGMSGWYINMWHVWYNDTWCCLQLYDMNAAKNKVISAAKYKGLDESEC